MDKQYFLRLKIGLIQSFDLLFPRLCLGCKSRLLISEKIICKGCFNDLICLKKHIGCDWEIEKLYFDQVYSSYLYDGIVRKIIHQFKYLRQENLAKYMVFLMQDTSIYQIKEKKYSYIIPIPLHSVKKRERGFNQASLLAGEISLMIEVPCKEDIVIRHHFTKSQTMKTHIDRIADLENAFRLSKGFDPTNLSFLIIDDVITTGSTVNQTAKVLKDHGAKRVDVLTFAFANK